MTRLTYVLHVLVIVIGLLVAWMIVADSNTVAATSPGTGVQKAAAVVSFEGEPDPHAYSCIKADKGVPIFGLELEQPRLLVIYQEGQNWDLFDCGPDSEPLAPNWFTIDEQGAMEFSAEAVAIIVGAIAALILLASLLWRTFVTERTFEATIRKLTPDRIEGYIVPASLIAFRAVDQKMRAYGDMTKEERIALASKMFKAILDFYVTGKMTDLAAEAIMEDRVASEKGE